MDSPQVSWTIDWAQVIVLLKIVHRAGSVDQPDIAFLVVDVVIHDQVPKLSQALIVFCGALLHVDNASQGSSGRSIYWQ